NYYGDALNERNLRMAEVPEDAALVRASDIAHWPVVACENVYILPGIPEIFRRKFLAVRERFRTAERFFLRTIYLDADEGGIAASLDRVQLDFPVVEIGSYPRIDCAEYRIKVTVESQDGTAVEQAFAALLALLPKDRIVRTEGI